MRKVLNKFTSRFSRDSKNKTHTASLNLQLCGQKTLAEWRWSYTATLEREATIRKQLEVDSERARPYFTNDKEGSNHEYAPAGWAAKQSSNSPELPNSPKTVSRKIMEVAHLVRLILFLVGMDRIAILVDLFKVRVSLTGNCGSLVSDRVCALYAAPRTHHTRIFFRAWLRIFFVCCSTYAKEKEGQLEDPGLFTPWHMSTLGDMHSEGVRIARLGWKKTMKKRIGFCGVGEDKSIEVRQVVWRTDVKDRTVGHVYHVASNSCVSRWPEIFHFHNEEDVDWKTCRTRAKENGGTSI